MSRAAILAVDGGNSKTDIALLDAAGTVLAAGRVASVSHQQVGLEAAASGLASAARELARAAGADAAPGMPVVDVAVLCLAGMDLPSDERALARAHAGLAPAGGLVLRNDAHAILRAGSPEGWGVSVVLGSGVNAIGLSRSGREARFAGLGDLSGDRGGGHGLGLWALGAAVRAQDGRGPHTALERLVPGAFGLRRPLDVTVAIYTGRLAPERVGDLAPVAIAAATDGDVVAMGLVDEVAGEAAAFATAAIRRLGLRRSPVPVVLGGALARGAWPLLGPRITGLVLEVAPQATVSLLDEPPVIGAALLGLDRLAPGSADAARRLRETLPRLG